MSLRDGYMVNDEGDVFVIVAGSPVGQIDAQGTALAELGPGYYDLDLIKVPDAEAVAPDAEELENDVQPVPR